MTDTVDHYGIHTINLGAPLACCIVGGKPGEICGIPSWVAIATGPVQQRAGHSLYYLQPVCRMHAKQMEDLYNAQYS